MQILLILLFFSFLAPDDEKPLQDVYLENYLRIESTQGPTPELVWAISLFYYSSPDEVKRELTEKIKTTELREALESEENLKVAINRLSFSLQDESLFLLTLLLEDNSELRTQLFDEFYTIDSQHELYQINSFARDGNPIEIEDLNLDQFHFKHFLIAFYISANNLSSQEYYNAFANRWSGQFKNGDHTAPAQDLIYSTLLMSLYTISDYSELSQNFNIEEKARFLPPSSLKRNLFWGVDYALGQVGLVEKSLEVQREFTIPLSRYIKHQAGLNSILSSQGAHLYHLGNYQKAREVLTELLDQTEQFSPPALAGLYNNLSLIYFKTGESADYIEMQSRALELAKEIENYRFQLQIYRNLHIFYRKNRNWDLAEQYINQAIELAAETENKTDQVQVYVTRAAFEHLFLNNHETAAKYLKLAEDLLGDETDSRLLISILGERSKLFNAENNWLASKKFQNKIIHLSLDSGDPSTYLEAFVELAYIHYQLGQFSETERLLKEFRAHDITILDFPVLVMAQTLSAQLAARSGDMERANSQYASVSNLVFERASNTSELETGYWNVEPEYLHLFESYADFLIEKGNYNQALNLLDRIKTINDATLTDNPLIQASRLTDAELAAEQNLAREMDRLRKRIFITSGRERLALQNRLEQLSAERRSLFKYRGTVSIHKESRVWALQRQLQRNEAVLHITEINSNYYLSILYRNSLSIEKLHLEDSDILMFESAISSLISGRTDLELLYEIGKFIDINSIPDYIESIIFIPDGFFHQLPLAILPVSKPDSPFSYGSARYMIEEKDIRTLNSLNDLSQRNPRFNHEYDYSGFGVSDFNNETTSRNLVSLPMAPKEVQNISLKLDRFTAKNTMINESATAENFKDLAGKSRILHMATHSEVSESDPLFSRLHFYASTGTDDSNPVIGQLFAYEFFDLNMQNELVMLNSCESGGDRYLQGSGIMGISRALRYAGVQSLVLNAWSVNDQFAAEFAELFYEQLNTGKTKSRALQLAKIEFIKSKNSNPHYWGPYILNGDNRPIIRSSDINLASYTLAFAFIMGLVLLNRANKKDKAA
jgi:hypothetical protein